MTRLGVVFALALAAAAVERVQAASMEDVQVKAVEQLALSFTKPGWYGGGAKTPPEGAVGVYFSSSAYTLLITPHVELSDAEGCRWLVAPDVGVSGSAKGRILVDPSTNRFVNVRFRVAAERCAVGSYNASVSLEFGSIVDSKYVAFGTGPGSLVSLQLDAQPSANASFVDLGACRALSYAHSCEANITLVDRDGFALPDSRAYQLQLDALMVERRARALDGGSGTGSGTSFISGSGFSGTLAKRRLAVVADPESGQLRLVVSAFKGPSSFRVSVLLAGTSLTLLGGSDLVTITCAEGGVDAAGNCACAAGSAVTEVPVKGFQGAFATSCTTCPACSPGQFSLATGATSQCGCTDCPEGSYCPITTGAPVLCPRGSACRRKSVAPELCTSDSFSDSEGQAACRSCNSVAPGTSTLGLLGVSDARGCTTCPTHATCAVPEHYVAAGASCVAGPRPAHAYRPALQGGRVVGNGSAAVQLPLLFVAYPEPGFFRFPPLRETGGLGAADLCASVDFFACPGGDRACPGGLDNASDDGCAAGYDGFLCMGCAEGYALSNRECLPCTHSEPYVFCAAAVVLVLFLTVILTWRTLRSELTRRRPSAEPRPRPTSASSSASSSASGSASSSYTSDYTSSAGCSSSRDSTKVGVVKSAGSTTGEREVLASDTYVSVIKIAYSHLQVIALLLSLDVDWHMSVSLVERVSALLSLSSSDVTSSAMCVFDGTREPDGFYLKVLIVFAFPPAAVALLALGWGLLYWRQPLRQWLGGLREHYFACQLTCMVLLFLGHLLLLRTALEVMVCTRTVDAGRSFLVADPRIECFEGMHTRWFLAAGLGGLLLYGVGIPALSAWIVHRGSNFFMHSFICKNFRPGMLFWESVVAGRKVLLTVFVITLDKFGPRVQGLVSLCVLFTALCLQVANQPFSYRFLNDLEACGLITAILSLTLALYSLEFDPDVDFGLNVLIAVANLLFALLVVYEIVAVTVNRTSGARIAGGGRRRSRASATHAAPRGTPAPAAGKAQGEPDAGAVSRPGAAATDDLEGLRQRSDAALSAA